MNIKNFNQFINEGYASDHAIEDLLMSVYGDDFLDMREEMLDTIYSYLSSSTPEAALELLIQFDYPELEAVSDKFLVACRTEGYESYTQEDWNKPSRGERMSNDFEAHPMDYMD